MSDASKIKVTVKNRKKLENQLLGTLKILEVSCFSRGEKGRNYLKWEKQLKAWSDKQFEAFLKDMVKNDKNFYFDMEPYKDEPLLDTLKEALEFNGATTEEWVYFRDGKLNDAEPDYRSIVPLPVLPLHIRRLQQIVTKKNAYTYSSGKRNAITNQASGDDEIARNSDIESYSLMIQGCEKTLEELMAPRADSGQAKTSMYRLINEQGYVRLDQLDQDVSQKAVLRMMDVYLLGAGIKSDLMSPGLVLNQSLKAAINGKKYVAGATK